MKTVHDHHTQLTAIAKKFMINKEMNMKTDHDQLAALSKKFPWADAITWNEEYRWWDVVHNDGFEESTESFIFDSETKKLRSVGTVTCEI